MTVPVALFTRAWIEINLCNNRVHLQPVALFTRAWIEIPKSRAKKSVSAVALFTRAWIEIAIRPLAIKCFTPSPSSRGRGLKYT